MTRSTLSRTRPSASTGSSSSRRHASASPLSRRKGQTTPRCTAVNLQQMTAHLRHCCASILGEQTYCGGSRRQFSDNEWQLVYEYIPIGRSTKDEMDRTTPLKTQRTWNGLHPVPDQNNDDYDDCEKLMKRTHTLCEQTAVFKCYKRRYI